MPYTNYTARVAYYNSKIRYIPDYDGARSDYGPFANTDIRDNGCSRTYMGSLPNAYIPGEGCIGRDMHKILKYAIMVNGSRSIDNYMFANFCIGIYYGISHNHTTWSNYRPGRNGGVRMNGR